MTTATQKRESAARRAHNRANGEEQPHRRVRARPIYPGRSYKITRRCSEQRMFFAPDAEAEKIKNLVGYCLARAANKCGIQVHACVFMSNHHHTDVTDPDGRIVEFKQLFHSMLARAINALRGRFEGVWSRDKACDTRRAEHSEALADLVYTLTNPVKDGLVKWSRQWPGFTTYGWCFGETRKFKRPPWFFDPSGDMPDEVELTLQRPPIYPDLSDDELFEKMMTDVREEEKAKQKERRRKNLSFMGIEKLLQQCWNQAAESFEERFTQAPGVVASCKWLLLAELQRDRNWERQYALAREDMLAGKTAVFPAGTYWLKRFAGVTVEERPTS